MPGPSILDKRAKEDKTEGADLPLRGEVEKEIEPSIEVLKEKETKESIEKKQLEEKKKKEKMIEEESISAAPILPTQSVEVAPMVKSERLLQIEKILSEDLEDIYEYLDEPTKKIFKSKGEETASKIDKMLQSVKIKAKEILKLILEWLKILSGVNKFFIQKQAKIKAEKILGLTEGAKKQ